MKTTKINIISCDSCHKPLGDNNNSSEVFYEYRGKSYHFECMNDQVKQKLQGE